MQVHEERAIAGRRDRLHQDVGRVHIEVLEAGLVSAGNHLPQQLDQLGPIPALPPGIVVGLDLLPELVQWIGRLRRFGH
jgi:hypothetical protein